LQTQRACSTFVVGAGGAIGIALALVAANPATAKTIARMGFMGFS
jgi:hypothetical protein